MLANKGFRNLLHYLDDFFGVIPPSEDALYYNDLVNSTCKELGLAIQTNKDKMHTVNDFLGIELGTIRMEARLPPEKLHKAIELVEAALRKKSISIEDLQSLVGFLAFAAKVVVAGRAFLRRLYNALSADFDRIRLASPIKQDLRWWKDFLPQWNGIEVPPGQWSARVNGPPGSMDPPTRIPASY